MAKQTFTTGQVLTAAQMTSLQANDYNWTVSAQTSSYVLTAVNAGQHVTMNAAGATTITVNTAIFTAGDTLRITNIGAGTCTITAGTATVTSAGALALTQWASGILYFTSASAAIFFPDAKTAGTSGMTLVSTGSTSAASTLTLDNVFTSSYRNYKLFIDGVTSADDIDVGLKFRAGGATNSNANYTRTTVQGAASGVTRSVTSNATSFTSIMAGGVTRITLDATFYAPQAAVNTGLSSICGSLSTNTYQYWNHGTFTAATQFDGFVFTPTSGTITVTYRLYGLAD